MSSSAAAAAMPVAAAGAGTAAAPMEVAPPEQVAPATTADSRYSFNEEKMQALKKESPWTKEAKYFDKVAISPSAIMKMVCIVYALCSDTTVRLYLACLNVQ